jgi:hypothetical protein
MLHGKPEESRYSEVKGPKTLAKHQTPNTPQQTSNIKAHFTLQDKTRQSLWCPARTLVSTAAMT